MHYTAEEKMLMNMESIAQEERYGFEEIQFFWDTTSSNK